MRSTVFDSKGIPERGLQAPHQTQAKSKLIAEYLRNFTHVTRGGLYIDGFAAPQSRKHEDAWTARRVLETEPKRIRGAFLCDLDPAGIAQLRDLKAKHHRSHDRGGYPSGKETSIGRFTRSSKAPN